MDIKNIVDIDAFTRGLTFTMASTGSIIPLAAVSMLQDRVSPMLPSSEYTGPLLTAFFDSWKIGIVAIK